MSSDEGSSLAGCSSSSSASVGADGGSLRDTGAGDATRLRDGERERERLMWRAAADAGTGDLSEAARVRTEDALAADDDDDDDDGRDDAERDERVVTLTLAGAAARGRGPEERKRERGLEERKRDRFDGWVALAVVDRARVAAARCEPTMMVMSSSMQMRRALDIGGGRWFLEFTPLAVKNRNVPSLNSTPPPSH